MKTNKLNFTTNFHALNESYIFLRFIWQQDHKPSRLKWANSYHLDDLLAEHKAEACLYRYGRFAYVMFNRCNCPHPETLRQQIASKDEYSHIKVELVYASESIELEKESAVITGAWLYQLLFNALANSVSNRLIFHNLNGKLIFLPIGKNRRQTIVAHEIILENDLVLTARARTYQTKAKIFHEETDKKLLQKKLSKPEYQFHLQTLKRVHNQSKLDWKSIYIQAGVSGTKASSDALSIKDHSSFLQSRMGILHTLYKRFNERYQGICVAKWDERPCQKSLEDRFRLFRNDRQFQKIATHSPLLIIDKIGDSDSQKIVKDIQISLKKLGVESKLRKRESLGAYHLCLVSPSNHYTNINDDPYRCDQRYIIQHLTDEKYRECLNVDQATNKGKLREIMLKNLLKELWIKESVIQHRLHLFMRDHFSLIGNWVFGTIIDDVYHMLEIDSEGKLAYFYDNRQMLFPDHPYQFAIDLLDNIKEENKKEKQMVIEAFIISPDQDINIILNEKEHVLPDLEQIETELLCSEASLPEPYTTGVAIENILSDLSSPTDPKWGSFMNELRKGSSLTKKTLNTLIKNHFHTSSSGYKTIRNRLLQHGIVLGFSKAKESIFNKMGDLFSIRAGEINENSAWYAVGYYYSSLQQSLSHMINLRVIRSLKGKNLYLDILPLLDVDFVRYNNITVLPFPMKYLREMIAIQHRQQK